MLDSRELTRSAHEPGSYPPDPVEYPDHVRRVPVRHADPADRRVRLRGPAMVPDGAPRGATADDRFDQPMRSACSSRCATASGRASSCARPGAGCITRSMSRSSGCSSAPASSSINERHARLVQTCSACISTSTTAIFTCFFKAAMDTFFLLLILGVLAEGMRRAIVKPTLLSAPPAEKMHRQSREPARLLVPDADDGAGRRSPV